MACTGAGDGAPFVRGGVHGQRGDGMTRGILLKLDEVNVVAACDEYKDRAEKAFEDVKAARGNEPFITTDYRGTRRD